MKTTLLLLAALLPLTTVRAADLPTVSIEHLYYLQARAARVQKFTQPSMVDYCLTQKLGGSGFESLYMQVFSMRIELMKLKDLEGPTATDARVIKISKTIEAHTSLLYEEAMRI